MRDNLQQMIKKYKLSKEDFCKRFEIPAKKYNDFTLGNYSYSLRDIAKMECAWHQLEKEREIEHVFKVADRPIFKDATVATVTEVKNGSLIKFEVTVTSSNEFPTDAFLFDRLMLDNINFGNHSGINVSVNWIQLNKLQMPFFTNAYGAVVDFICSIKKNWKISFSGIDGYTVNRNEKKVSKKLVVTQIPEFVCIDALTHLQLLLPKKGTCKLVFEEVAPTATIVSPITTETLKQGDVIFAVNPKSKKLTDGSAYNIEWKSAIGSFVAVKNDDGEIRPYSINNFRLP